MSSLFKSTYRFLYKHQRMYKFELTMMQFMRKYALQANQPAKMRGPFTELKKKLVQLSKDAYERHALNYFDFISWLDSKIENRPFAVIVRRKSKNG